MNVISVLLYYKKNVSRKLHVIPDKHTHSNKIIMISLAAGIITRGLKEGFTIRMLHHMTRLDKKICTFNLESLCCYFILKENPAPAAFSLNILRVHYINPLMYSQIILTT